MNTGKSIEVNGPGINSNGISYHDIKINADEIVNTYL